MSRASTGKQHPVPLDTALIVVGGSMLVLGLLSRVLKRLLLSSVLIALLLGVLLGPEVLGVLNPAREGDERRILEEIARVTLALALMGAGLQITRADLRTNARRFVGLLSVGMVGMWMLTGLGAWLLLDLPFWAAFLLGAILTPTDPVVASALVTGGLADKNLPRWLRRSLQLESGANDGLALPFVLLAAFMLTEPAGAALGHWVTETVKGVGLAVALGAPIGYASGKLTELSLRRSEIEETNLIGLGISLALLTVGLIHLLGGSGILAVFVAAIFFSMVLESEVREQLEQVQDSVSKYLILPVFIFLGAILPWSQWWALGVSGLAFAAWVLLVRRPPVVPLALAGSGTGKRGTAFLGWFGPIGVAAVFYVTYIERFNVPESERIFAAATLAICASVLVHSVTATPGVRWFAGRSPLATLRHPLRAEVEESP